MALIGEMKYLQIGGNTYEIPTSELPIASSSTLGGIKVGNNLSIDSSTGVLSASFTETDPTVPSWAKASTKPTYTASEVGAVAKTGDTMTGQLIVPHDTNTKKGGVCFNNVNAYPDITIVGGGGYYDSSYGTEYPYLTFYYGTSPSNKVILNNIDTPRGDYNAANKQYVDNKFSGITFPVTSVNGQTGAVTLSIPTISITRNLTSGTKSATINISGIDYDIYSATPPLAATTVPVVDGIAAVGSSSKYAKEDHVHPTDTSRAATTTVATQASINSTGLITYKNSSGTSLFTLQLPLYNGGVS